jgi:hypothetical protein
VRDAILLQSGDFTISVEPGRGHIAQQFVDDARLLLSARTQDLLAPGAGDAQGEGRLAAAPGVLGKVIQGMLKGAACRGQNLVAIGCGDVDAGAVRHIAEEVDTAAGLIGTAWSTQVIPSTIIGRYRQWILRQVRDVGIAEELPVERGRGLAIDGPHHVAVDISDPPLAPDRTPSCIDSKGEDDTLVKEKERHGILEHFRAVELPGALESPLVAGGPAKDRDGINSARSASRAADPLTVRPSGIVMQRRGAPPLPEGSPPPSPARRWTASLALARIDPATSVETDLATPDTA